MLYIKNLEEGVELFKALGSEVRVNIIRLLLENKEMKDKFLRQLGDVFQPFTTEYMQCVLDQCIAEIQPELQLHFSRWAEFNDKVINSDSPLSPDGAYRYWEKRIDRLRNTVCVWRPYRLYGYIQDGFDLTDAQMREYFGERPPKPEE